MAERFGPFVLERLLGRGGMAEAFVASRAEGGPNDPIILKRIRPEHASSSEYERRFVLEAQVASRAGHPNLAEMREFGRVGGCLYLAMTQVRGIGLHRLLDEVHAKRLRLPEPVAVHMGLGLLRGLSALHSLKDEQGRPRPMLHRDVNPKNVIVSVEGEAVLIDFGISKDVYGPSITIPGQFIGTTRYMAPEHRNAEFLDPRADVFSVSVILFELFFGRHPWRPLPGMQELLRTTFDPPELREDERKTVPEDVLTTVFKGLECLPEHRFADAARMERALAFTSASDLDGGASVVRAWLDELGWTLDEDLGTPVLDVPTSDGEGSAEIFWTSEGLLSSEVPRPSTSEVLSVPPLPPRRDEGLDGGETVELDAFVARTRRASSLRTVAVALGLGVVAVLFILGLR
ncbi:MAG: serine/threonine-protein kinase [Myxococcota bacterium]